MIQRFHDSSNFRHGMTLKNSRTSSAGRIFSTNLYPWLIRVRQLKEKTSFRTRASRAGQQCWQNTSKHWSLRPLISNRATLVHKILKKIWVYSLVGINCSYYFCVDLLNAALNPIGNLNGTIVGLRAGEFMSNLLGCVINQ